MDHFGRFGYLTHGGTISPWASISGTSGSGHGPTTSGISALSQLILTTKWPVGPRHSGLPAVVRFEPRRFDARDAATSAQNSSWLRKLPSRICLRDLFNIACKR